MNNVYLYGGTITATGGFQGNGVYYPPLGAIFDSLYTGSIHLSDSMEMIGASLTASGTLEYGYSPTVTIQPGEGAGAAYTVSTSYEEALGTVMTSLPMAHAGDVINVTATPETGCELISLTVTDRSNNEITVTNDTFTMPASSVTVAAVFRKIDYTVTINGSTYGTASSDHNTANYSDTVLLTMEPNDEDCDLVSLIVVDGENHEIPVTDGKFTMPASNVTVTVVYNKDLFRITSYSHELGSVTAPEKAAKGSTVSLTITPDVLCRLKANSLTVTDSHNRNIPVASNNTFTMPEDDVTVNAEFERLYPIITEQLHGSVQMNVLVAAEGDTVFLNPIPDAGYQYVEGSLTVTKANDDESVTVSPATAQPTASLRNHLNTVWASTTRAREKSNRVYISPVIP